VTTAHEPRGGPGTHLSTEDVSALAEGAQPSAQGAAEHLARCAVCRGEVDAMSELLAQFEEWDTPAMPQEVAIRIDAALARESAARAATAGHPAAAANALEASAASGTAPSASTPPGNTSPAGTSPAGTPSGNASAGSGFPGSASPASSSPGSKPSGDDARPRRRFWRPSPGLSWAAAALVLIAGGLGLIVKLSISSAQSSQNSVASSGSGSAAQQPFTAQRSPELNAPDTRDQPAPSSSTVRAPNSALAVWTTQTLSEHHMGAMLDPSCLADPKFADSHQLATAAGSYGGQVAMLVIYANPQNPATVRAVIYASPCSSGNFRVLDEGLVAKPAAANAP